VAVRGAQAAIAATMAIIGIGKRVIGRTAISVV
jgi:hypothetical protein